MAVDTQKTASVRYEIRGTIKWNFPDNFLVSRSTFFFLQKCKKRIRFPYKYVSTTKFRVWVYMYVSMCTHVMVDGVLLMEEQTYVYVRVYK